MKRLILIIGIISSFYCYAQRVESLMNLTVKGSSCLPTLSPFLSNLWIFHTRDSVYGIYSNSYENKIFRGAGVGLEYSITYDFFLDSTRSMVADVGIVHYFFRDSTILAIKDSISPAFNIYALNPMLKILLAPDSDKKSFRLKKIKYNNKFEITEEELIGKITSPDSTTVNWQLSFLTQIKFWSVWRITNWFYKKGSYLVCLNILDKKVKVIPFIPGGPAIVAHSVTWERVDIPGRPHSIIRMKILESKEDIGVEIIDTTDVSKAKIVPLGSFDDYTLWGLIGNWSVNLEFIDKNNNKISVLELPNTGDKFRAGTLSASYVPLSDNVCIVNIYFQHEDYSTTDNKIFKVYFPYTSIAVYNNIHFNLYQLYQNYPNPFNPITTIEFDIPEITNVKLIVYDILGREVETLIDKELEPGKYKINFDATNLPSGVYFYTLKTPKFTKTNKMVLIK